MTTEEISQVKILCKNFRDTDISASIVERFNTNDLNSLSAGRYSAAVLLEYTYLTIDSIESILADEDLVTFFPSILVYQGGQHNFISNLNALWNALTHSLDLPTASANLDILVGALVIIGRWRTAPMLNETQMKALEVERASSKSKELLAEARKTNKTIKDLQKDIESLKGEVSQFLNDKKADFTSITNYVDQSQAKSNEINNLLQTVTQNSTQIASLNSTAKEDLKKLESTFNEEISRAQKLYSSGKSDLSIVRRILDDASNKLATISEKEIKINDVLNTFISKDVEMKSILGNIAAEGLSRTFKERSEQLEASIALWRRVSFWSLVILGAWVIGLFVSLIIWTNIDVFSWQALLSTTIRSIPPALFVYFAFNQYSRERTYKEEYAFKSAVALTINSFADTMGQKVDDFRYQAILRVYKEPVFHRNKSFFNRKQIEKVYRDVFGVAKDLSSIIKK